MTIRKKKIQKAIAKRMPNDPLGIPQVANRRLVLAEIADQNSWPLERVVNEYREMRDRFFEIKRIESRGYVVSRLSNPFDPSNYR